MTIFRKLAVAGLAATIALPALAQGQPGGAGEPRPAQAGERAERGGAERGGHHDRRQGPRGGASLWNTAEKLTAARTALAITPEQEGAWNDFTAAAIAFVQAGRPGPNPERGGPAPQEEEGAEPGARTLTDLPAVRMLDRMIERSTERAEAAQSLRTAVDGLSAVLTPEQVETAERLLSELRGPRGHRGDGPRGHGRAGGERPGASERGPAEAGPPPAR
ncbi:Spy/CpxP family protein refolding chaperone [Aureimonas populi]|uniref:Spy/CpxP family protein refolding chaperone n=1 Tax=Aureimonas populi TaxID=1701758 RepID=A0ABW5CL98_9HYPH|nr:Spy/CpxP family protein refolding chaperone [Aureimonas populi]